MSAARRPAPALAGLIEQYYGTGCGDTHPGCTVVCPSRHVTFIVSIGSPIDIAAQTDRGRRPDRTGAYSAACRPRPR